MYLNAANAYSGVTIWGGSTLELCGTTASLNYIVSDCGALAFNCSGTATFAGAIPGPGSLAQEGFGTLVLTGANTYIGGTTIMSGTLQLGNGTSAGSIGAYGSVTDYGTLAFDCPGTTTFSGSISGFGNVTQMGTGTLVLTGANSYSSGTIVNGGVLSVSGSGDLGSGALTLDGGTLQTTAAGTFSEGVTLGSGGGTVDNDGNAVTFSGVIWGSGGLTEAGSGTLTLDGSNRYSGGTVIDSGTLQLGAANALPTGTAVTVDSPGTLDLGGFSPSIAGLSDGPDGGGTVTNSGAALSTLTLTPAAGTPASFSGTIQDGAGGGTVSVLVDGTGTQILAGYNTYSGPTAVEAGTLQAGAEYALSPASDMIVDGGAILDMNGFDNEVNTLAGAGTVENSASGTTVWLGVGNDATGSTFTGTLTDAGGGTALLGLAKLGADTFVLDGTNNFSGPTIVEGGNLEVDTPFGASPVQWAGGTTTGIYAPSPSSYATTLTVTCDAGGNATVTGQSVTFTATVNGLNTGYFPTTGTVDFHDEGGNGGLGADLGDGTCNGDGTWTLGPISNFTAGDHFIVATYNPPAGSSTYVTSTGGCDQTVNPADTTTAVVVPGSDPTFGNVTLAATVTVNSPGNGTPTGTVEFWDGITDLGAGSYDRTSGEWTLSGNTLAPGSHQITAVYSGDGNFNTSQSQATAITVDGNGLSLGNSLCVRWGTISEGDAATLGGTVSGLDGAAFSVTVNWGDGQSSDSDNPNDNTQPFYFTAGTTSFSVSHYYADPGNYTVVVTVTPTDTTDSRAVTGSVGLTVSAVAPQVVLAVPPEPDGGYYPDTAYDFAATGYSPDGGTMDYLWTVYDPANGNVTATYTGPSVQLTGRSTKARQ